MGSLQVDRRQQQQQRSAEVWAGAGNSAVSAVKLQLQLDCLAQHDSQPSHSQTPCKTIIDNCSIVTPCRCLLSGCILGQSSKTQKLAAYCQT
jgi:hypothetical protein